MHSTPAPHPQHATAPREWSMDDVWGSYPGSGAGSVAAEVTRQVAAHAPLVPVNVGPVTPDGRGETRARLRPYRDSLAWTLLKHGVQLALVASVVLFVLQGGRAPLVSLGYVGTALLMMLVVVVADRERFRDRDPGFEIVEFLPPEPREVVQVAAVHQGALTPLVHQMQTVLPQRVDVT